MNRLCTSGVHASRDCLERTFIRQWGRCGRPDCRRFLDAAATELLAKNGRGQLRTSGMEPAMTSRLIILQPLLSCAKATVARLPANAPLVQNFLICLELSSYASSWGRCYSPFASGGVAHIAFLVLF